MAGHPLELRYEATGLDVANSQRVGLSGLLGDRGIRARPSRAPGSLSPTGFRWARRDNRSPTWWPQGVAVGDHDGVPLAMASWYAKPLRDGTEMGARLSVVDLRDPSRPRYSHVLLVTGDPFEPVQVHAGGIVWAGDRLLVAATFGGILEFRLSDILLTAAGPFGYRHVLPQFAAYRPTVPRHPERMRYSFVSLESEADGLSLVAGEYRPDDLGRLVRLRLTENGAVPETHVPGIERMQGAVVRDGRWFVTASRGRDGGDLWTGVPGTMTRHPGALPPGPEDLAVWPEREQLWSLSEFPRKRWMFALDLGSLGD